MTDAGSREERALVRGWPMPSRLAFDAVHDFLNVFWRRADKLGSVARRASAKWALQVGKGTMFLRGPNGHMWSLRVLNTP
jgi:hypothetical protein